MARKRKDAAARQRRERAEKKLEEMERKQQIERIVAKGRWKVSSRPLTTST
jgi:hypothetical protein